MSETGLLQPRYAFGGSLDLRTTTDRLAQPISVATLGRLDGAIVARLRCHPSLGTVLLGRSITAEIMIEDPFIHRVHADLRWDSALSGHIITDAGGVNGTYVNLQRINQPTRLADGARIRVGKTELVYRRAFYPES